MKPKPLVYLAGGIAGLSFDAATDWRHSAMIALAVRGIETLNPMRCKEVLAGQNGGVISETFRDYADNGTFFTSRAIMMRDFNDVRRCDAAVLNLLGLKKISAGTVMELGWLYAFQKPAIVAVEAGNPHLDHPMIFEAMPFRVSTLDEAFESVAVLLNR